MNTNQHPLPTHTHTCTQQIVRYLFVDQWHITKSKPMCFVRSAHHLEKLHTNSDNKIVITTTLLSVETASYIKGRLCRLLLFHTHLLGRGIGCMTWKRITSVRIWRLSFPFTFLIKRKELILLSNPKSKLICILLIKKLDNAYQSHHINWQDC